MKRFDSISNIAEQVVITISDNDNALNAAKRYMGGSVCVGTQGADID